MANYIVQRGDTLSHIANAHNMSVKDLAELNGISDPNKIRVNQVLVFGEENAAASGAQKEQMFVPESLNDDLVGLDTVEFARNEASKETDYAPLAYAAGGAAIYGAANKAMPYVKKGVKKTVNAGKEVVQKGVDAGKSAANTVAQRGKETANTVKKFVNQKSKEIKKEGKKLQKTVTKKYNKTKKTTLKQCNKVKKSTVQTFNRSERILNGKRVQVKGMPIKLGKYGKVLGKAATPVNVAVSAFQIGEAYAEGGTKAAVKQTGKCAAGIAGGWAGAKLGAAIGTAICPGIGTAIGGFIGGIGGYILGENLADSAMS